MNIDSTYHRSHKARAEAIRSASKARVDAFRALEEAEQKEQSSRAALHDHFQKTESRAYTLGHAVGFGIALASTGVLAGVGQLLGLPLNGAAVLAVGVAGAAVGIGAGLAVGKTVRSGGKREVREKLVPPLQEALKESIVKGEEFIEAMKHEQQEINKPLLVITSEQ